jgi:fatty acid desaturase
VEARGKWLRLVRLAAVAALIGLLAVLPLAAYAATRGKEPAGPSYVLSNLVAVIMCVVAVAIPCKRYHGV